MPNLEDTRAMALATGAGTGLIAAVVGMPVTLSQS